MKNPLTSEILNNIPWVTHGFFPRADEGGVPLDCAFHAGNTQASKNRQKIIQALGVQNLATVEQTHSTHIAWVDDPSWLRENAPEADALATSLPNMAVGILTADCVPVLFASKKDKIVAASHAGWKGALNNILSVTMQMMMDRGCNPSDIVAVIGPSIGGISYEVRDDFKTPFIEQDIQNKKFFARAEKEGHLYFDLPNFVAQRLWDAGIGHVEDMGQDTLPQRDQYYSYRRSCLTDDVDSRYGRQMSAIGIIG